MVTNIISYPLQSTKVRKIFCQFGRKLLLSHEGDSSCCALISTNSIKGLLKFKIAGLINVQSKLSIDPQDHITKLMYRKINMILWQNLVMGPRRGCVFDKKGCLQTRWGIWHHMGLTVKTIFSGLPHSRLMEIMMQWKSWHWDWKQGGEVHWTNTSSQGKRSWWIQQQRSGNVDRSATTQTWENGN